MAKVFLSYAREDAGVAKQLAESVGRGGHEVWWDHHLHGGSRFAAEIDRELKQAEAVVVLWTDTSIGSAWVQDEAAEGRDSGRLVPVALGSAKPPLGFRQFHTITLGPPDGDGFSAAVGELLVAIEQTSAAEGAKAKAGEPQAKSAQRKTSVCVLPFVNMSGDAEQEYFSDGISEDIITDLSNVSALSVVARNTAFSFKGQSPDVKEVAKSLGVSHVLEGSVRKAGNRVRITAQLIDGAEGDHVWAQRFDRDLTDIFAIQDEISKAIVDALRVKLLPDEKKAIASRGTTNADAYNIYLMARQQWISGPYGAVRREEAIVRLCRQAVLLDPEYAQAWALMGLAQVELRFVHAKNENPLPAAERALEINPLLPEAHCIKARCLEEEGRTEEAEKQIRTALKLDPDSWEVNRESARMLFRHGHVREAIPHFEKAASLMENDWHNMLMLITCYESTGDETRLREVAQAARQRIEPVVANDPTNGTALASGAKALAVLGDSERAREWMQRALLLDPDNLTMRYNVACTLLRPMGEIDEALDTLDPFFEKVTSTTWIWHAEADPDLDEIHDNPRFKTMLDSAKQRLGITT